MSDQRYSECDIKDFLEFLEKCLKQKVLDYSIKPLTKNGDNFSGIIRSVDVKVAGINGIGVNLSEIKSILSFSLSFLNASPLIYSIKLCIWPRKRWCRA